MIFDDASKKRFLADFRVPRKMTAIDADDFKAKSMM